ncbi:MULTISPECIES: NAD-dependent epimerase/dehydratase family protein [Rhodomicrobium]|uniref:UDP-2-acetamido-2,6-beta-L-arabino-hexul-4-ose reductase n=1 Tax=Rhodomicrobium TaxID=1068 RepID=UPI000B4C070F|nr:MULTISPECIES: NAD-dependent epimerase/dehydratase family protein [Rhodomicrobium]
MRVLVTGSGGFIAKNLLLVLAERADVELLRFDRRDDAARLPELMREVDFVFHLAGVNRPKAASEFASGNRDLTRAVCHAARTIAETSRRRIPILLASSIQAGGDTPYGRSKRAAEQAAFAVRQSHGVPVHVFRLPNVFGKWGRPDYNSVVATFCSNIARDLPIDIRDADAALSLVHVDDVIGRFIQLMDGATPSENAEGYETVAPQYETTVGAVAALIRSFKASRATLTTEAVGSGFARALYATYVSYLPPASFAYAVPQHKDARGAFVEMLKTRDSGQFSYFSAFPGATRGGHYHHSKTEKFLVIKGRARFKFRHMQTGETCELHTSGETSEIVETPPGWAHDITNIGECEMIVLLWANEVFDRARPDTYAFAL